MVGFLEASLKLLRLSPQHAAPPVPGQAAFSQGALEARALPGDRVMIERWGVRRSPVPLLPFPLVREESFRVLGCSGGSVRGRG